MAKTNTQSPNGFRDHVRRLLYVISQLRAGSVTKIELAEALDCDIRTITRYFTLLREFGAEIEYDPDTRGHYLVDKKWRLDK